MSEKTYYRQLSFALVVGFLAYLEFGISRVGAAILVVGENHPAIQLGVVMGLYSVAPLLMAVHAGSMASHFGPRRSLICGAAILLCGAGVQAASGPYVLIFLGALLTGIGFTILQISLQLHIGESSGPNNRVRNFGYFSMVQSAATSLAALLVGYLSGSVNLHAPLKVSVGVALMLPVAVVVNRKLFRSNAIDSKVEGSRYGSFLQLIRQSNIRKVLVAGALLAMAWDLHSFIVPFISRQVKLSPQQIGVILGLFSGATFVIRVFLPKLVTLVSSVWVIRAALILVGLCFAAYPWHATFVTMAMLAVVLGLSLGTAQPNLLALLHDVAAARDVGRLIGVRTILLNIGSSLWPLCFSALGQSVVAFMLLGAGFVFFFFGINFTLTRVPYQCD